MVWQVLCHMLSKCSKLLQEELVLLRAVWDMVSKILGKFNDCYGTPWASVSVDTLLEESRTLSKDVKSLSKAVRLYDVYGQALWPVPDLHTQQTSDWPLLL